MLVGTIPQQVEYTPTGRVTVQPFAKPGDPTDGNWRPVLPPTASVPGWYVEKMDPSPRPRPGNLLPLKLLAGVLLAYVVFSLCCLKIAVERRAHSENYEGRLRSDSAQNMASDQAASHAAEPNHAPGASGTNGAAGNDRRLRAPASVASTKRRPWAVTNTAGGLIEPLAELGAEAGVGSGAIIQFDPSVVTVLRESQFLSDRLHKALSQPRVAVMPGGPERPGPDDRVKPGAAEDTTKPLRHTKLPLPRVGPITKFATIRPDVQAHADYVYSQVSQVRGSRVAWFWKQRILRMEDRLEAEFLRRYAATGDEFGSRYLVLSKLPIPRFRSRGSELRPGATISLADL